MNYTIIKLLFLIVITAYLVSSCKGKTQPGDQSEQTTEQRSLQQKDNNNPETQSAPEKSQADM